MEAEVRPLLPPRAPARPPAAQSKHAHPYLPILDWLPGYPWAQHLPADVAGGVTLGCILMAQSLAHASLCGVALIHGPYSCMLPPVVYALFGTCIHSSVGTGGLVSLLVGVRLAEYGDLAHRTRAAAVLTLEVGLALALMGALQLGWLVRFLSRPALSGFMTASALMIMGSQLPPMLGLPSGAGLGPRALARAHWPTVALSGVAYAWLVCAQQFKSRPGLAFLSHFKELLLLIAAGAFCSVWDVGVAVVGQVPEGLPEFSLPVRDAADLQLARELLPGALLIALVVFLSSWAGAKKFALKDGYKIGSQNEMLALGLANVAGAFQGAVPTQIGLSRMGIAYGMGVKSQLGANVLVAAVVALGVLCLSPAFAAVPRPVLNAIIVSGAAHLTEFEQARYLWRVVQADSVRYRTDVGVWWVGLVSTLCLGAFEGILVAVGVSLVLIVYQVVNPPITELAYKACNGKWVCRLGHPEARVRKNILVFRIEGPIFYANVERLQEWLEEQEVHNHLVGENPLYGIVLNAAAVPFVDTSALQALQAMLEGYHKRGVIFVFANTVSQAGRVFQRELGHLLPPESLAAFFSVEDSVGLIESRIQRDDRLERCVSMTYGSALVTSSGRDLRGGRLQDVP